MSPDTDAERTSYRADTISPAFPAAVEASFTVPVTITVAAQKLPSAGETTVTTGPVLSFTCSRTSSVMGLGQERREMTDSTGRIRHALRTNRNVLLPADIVSLLQKNDLIPGIAIYRRPALRCRPLSQV
jgi:hypothetical protein